MLCEEIDCARGQAENDIKTRSVKHLLQTVTERLYLSTPARSLNSS